jgi:predicted O-linked N-acetylglucosamine transferase (SPINDLY family)
MRLEAGFLCYRPADDVPDVAPPPCLAGGRITFGSFNNLAKVSADAMALWARILKQVRGSRLLIKSRVINDESIRRRIRRAFAAHGVDSRRLDLRGRQPSNASHMAMYGEVDVALDTFPYNGTTTTFDALTMGVPVVTLAGRTHASRVGVSILTHAGLGEWIAKDPDDYVAKAVALAGEIGRLEELRRTLRGQVLKSPLGDAEGMARKLERAYRAMWAKWCDTVTPSPRYSGERAGERG